MRWLKAHWLPSIYLFCNPLPNWELVADGHIVFPVTRFIGIAGVGFTFGLTLHGKQHYIERQDGGNQVRDPK